MSFAKAPIKRFNENDTDTPGPNKYDPKNIDGKGTGAGVALSLKANRFTEKSEATPGPGEYNVLEDKKNYRRSMQVSMAKTSFRKPRSPNRSTSSIRSSSSGNNSTLG